MVCAVSQERILEDSMCAALREQYIFLPDQHFPWRWRQYMLIDQYIFSRIRAMYIYRANNTIVFVQSNTYCGSKYRHDVRVNAYCSDQYAWGPLWNTYWLSNMLPDRGCKAYWLWHYDCLQYLQYVYFMFNVLLWTILIEPLSSNYYRLVRWHLLWRTGYASSIGGDVPVLHLMRQRHYIKISICSSNTRQYVLNLTACWWSAW